MNKPGTHDWSSDELADLSPTMAAELRRTTRPDGNFGAAACGGSIMPIPGGNANACTYPLEPINQYDLNGMWWKWVKKAAAWAVGVVKGKVFKVARAAVVWGNYSRGGWFNGGHRDSTAERQGNGAGCLGRGYLK